MSDRGASPVQTQTLTRFRQLIARARTALLWERVWPLLWLPVSVVLLFMTVSWLGLWLDLPPLARMVGLALFAVALAASLIPLFRFAKPTRSEVLLRLDRDTGVGHAPAHALVDTLTLGASDPGTQALWSLHRRRAEDAIGRMQVASPRPDMPRRDRYALRAVAVLAVVASAFVAGPEMRLRLVSAFDWRAPVLAGPLSRIDGWIDPPLYTRAPPIMIDLAKSQNLRAPLRSTIVIRAAGDSKAEITAGAGLTALPAKQNARADLREERFMLEGHSEIVVKSGFASAARLSIEAIPDRAPEIAFTGQPEFGDKGGFTLIYKGRDDYGIASILGSVTRATGGGRSLVPAPDMPLVVPSHLEEAPDTKALVDLSTHPWAGAKVKLRLTVKDEAGQEASSETIDFSLPQRAFTNPLAKALVEQRRDLVLAPDDRKRVQTALDALLINPQDFTPQWGVFMGLKTASDRLRRSRNDEQLVEVADWLWAMALQLEDGDLSDSEQQLRAAQERLKEAIERNAPDEEIKRLTDELRQAMNKFLNEFAQRMRDNPRNAEPNQRQAERTITQNDLNRMLERMEDAMRKGDMAEAQRLLDELRNILENLRTARPNSRMSDPLGREMNRSMQDLDDMARKQQQLRDETFRDGQNRRMQQGERNRQQGQRRPGQQGQAGSEQEQAENGQQGEGPGQEQDPLGKELGRRQQALREQLRELQRRMQGQGMQNEQGLSDAEEAMGEAEGALGQGQDGEAVDAQGRALEGLRRGMQGMAQQMQQMQEGQQGNGQATGEPQQEGEGDPSGRGQTSQPDNDPLGRPTGSPEANGGRPIPNESPAQRAGRILEELRRKLADPARPQEELEYFDRLLRSN